ncbi:hypothetical protein FVE85_1848 [Porphyridium purpureum]|uniref:Haem-binding uptake Tiki superfamily ChaN domain-containing protein n=1 Tax=Porphyridium purpureum TaxID=35688 RepID=A0A5J4YYI7_PORPP|nr:hypothetical protein FVE85_1848 [Porphyridium purpureum]|eukprot:POR4924..scf209_3
MASRFRRKVVDASGTVLPYSESLESLVRLKLDEVPACQVVLCGEIHTDPHAASGALQLLNAIYSKFGENKSGSAERVALSLEFFETDTQLVLDEYLAGLISEEEFLQLSRPPSNYATQYRGLVEFCRQRKLRVIAANAPRRYVKMIRRTGRDKLGESLLDYRARALLPPLPIAGASSQYERKFIQTMQQLRSNPQEQRPVPASMLDAQSLWDATMAWNVSRALDAGSHDRDGEAAASLVFHVTGSFHVEHKLGIHEHLQRYRPNTQILTFVFRPMDELAEMSSAEDADTHTELRGLADYTILNLTPADP